MKKTKIFLEILLFVLFFIFIVLILSSPEGPDYNFKSGAEQFWYIIFFTLDTVLLLILSIIYFKKLEKK